MSDVSRHAMADALEACHGRRIARGLSESHPPQLVEALLEARPVQHVVVPGVLEI